MAERGTFEEQGDAVAQYNLGMTFRNGEGVPEDDTTAVKWYRLVAEQGVVRECCWSLYY